MKSLFTWFRRDPQVSPPRARRRAARGAAYLDRVDPGWHRRLDLGALALGDGTSCVLGQLHGTFRRGLGRARLFKPGSAPRASLSPVAHGFHCMQAAGGDEEAEQRDYALLNRAWQKEIRDRQLQDRRRERGAEKRARASRPRDRPQTRRTLPGEPATDTVPA